MNKSLRVISLSLITTLVMSCVPSTNAECVSSGFGVGLTFGVHKNGVQFGVDNLNKLLKSKNESLISQLKAAIANTNKKFETPNTAETEMEEDSGTHKILTYDAEQNNAAAIAGAEANKLPEEANEIELKTRKYKSDNPTKYIIVSSGDTKYDSNGMHSDADDAASIEKLPILSNPGILEYNGYTGEQADGAEDSDATVTANYAHITDGDGNALSLTPKDYFRLQNMDSDTAPTHVLLSDLSGDKTTYSLLTSILGNKTTLEEYQKQFKDDELLLYNKNYYIDTVKHKDLGLGDTFVDSAISTLNTNTATSQTFKEVSKYSFDIGAIVFYQYRIYDWFVRTGVFGNFPVANKTVSLMENTEKTGDNNKSSDNNLSLEHSFDVGAQILGGYNISQNLSAVFGVEFGYTKWILNNLDKLASKYSLDSSALAGWVKAGTSTVLDDYNKSLQDMGLSSKEKKLGKWFWRGVVGLEYNISNFIIALQAYFGPRIKLMKQSNKTDLGNVVVSNMGLRLNLAFKF